MKDLKYFVSNNINEGLNEQRVDIPRDKYVFMFFDDNSGTGGVIGFNKVSELEDMYSAEPWYYDFLLKVKPCQVVENDGMQYWRIK